MIYKVENLENWKWVKSKFLMSHLSCHLMVLFWIIHIVFVNSIYYLAKNTKKNYCSPASLSTYLWHSLFIQLYEKKWTNKEKKCFLWRWNQIKQDLADTTTKFVLSGASNRYHVYFIAIFLFLFGKDKTFLDLEK